MKTESQKIHTAVQHMRAATTIDAALLRIRLADDPEALRTVDAIERRVERLASTAEQFIEVTETLLDAVALAEEHQP